MGRLLKIIFLLFLSFTILSSCKKYPDGPALSLRSKMNRVTNVWTIEKYLIDDVDQTTAMLAGFYENTFQMKKDGTYSENWNSFVAPLTDGGKWEFIENKEAIKKTSDGTGTSDTLTILRLKNKEFWIKKRNGTQAIVIHYIKY